MLRKCILFVVVMACACVLFACDSVTEQSGRSVTAPEPGNEGASVAPSAADGTPSSAVRPVDSPETAVRSIKRIAFAEENETADRMLVSWETAELPKTPLKVVCHWETLSIVLEFAEADPKIMSAMLDQIEVDGKKPEIIRMEHDGKQVLMKLQLSVGASAQLHLEGMPDVTIERQELLRFVPVNTAGEGVPDALLLQAGEYGVHLLLPMEADSVVLRFSEDMRPLLPVARDGGPIQAEWKDVRNLRIALEEAGSNQEHTIESYFRLDSLEAVSGNRLNYEGGSLVIRRTPSFVWKYSVSGEPFTAGPRAAFYDQLIVSPDAKSYVGVVSIGGPMGDGDGWSYAFVLERMGKEPAVLEHAFYSTVDPGDAPISWTGPDSLMYASYFGVFAYDVTSLTKTTIRSHQRNESDNINFAVWDPFRKMSYILAYQNRMDSGMVSADIYDGAGKPVKTVRDFAESVLINKYGLLDLSVLPVADGVYWTKSKEGLPYTEYAANDGSLYTAGGVARLAVDGGVYLQLYKDGGQNIIPVGWVFWRPGGKERIMAEPPGPGRFFVSGNELILSLEGSYYRYDARQDAWPEWKPPGREKGAEPVSGPGGLYKVRR